MRAQAEMEERREELREWEADMKWRALHPGQAEKAEEEFWDQWHEEQEAVRAAADAKAKEARKAAALKAQRKRKAIKAAVADSGQAVLLNTGPAPVVVAVAGSVKTRHSVVSPDGWTTVVPRGTVLDNASN